MVSRIGACALLLIASRGAAAQVIDGRPADSLSVNTILEVVQREAGTGRSEASVASARMLGARALPPVRADSLLQGLKTLALTGATPDVRTVAIGALASSGTAYGQPQILLEAFDSARDGVTRRAILNAVPSLSNADVRRQVLLRALATSGDRASAYVVSLAVMTALQLGDEGRAILWDAINRSIIRDQRALRYAQDALQAVPRVNSP